MADRRYVPAGDRRALTIGLILGVTTVAFEAMAVGTAMPAVSDELQGLSLYGWVFSAFMLGTLVGIVAAGEQSDRTGPRLPFLGGLGLFAIGMLGAGFATSMPMLIAFRLIQGLGGGALFSSFYVALGMGYPPEERSRVLAMLSSAWVIPALVGPSLAGWVTDQWGWRWVFLGLLPLPLFVAGLSLPGLRLLSPVSEPATGNRVRSGLALPAAVGTGLVLAGLGARHVVVAAALVAAGAALAAPALRRLLPVGTLRFRPVIPAAVANRGLLAAAFFGADAFIPLTLTKVRGMSNTGAGSALTMAGLFWAAGSWTQARFGQRRPARVTAFVGTAGVVLAIVGVSTVLIADVPVYAAHAAWAVAGFGMGLGFNTVSVVVLSHAPAGQVGAATSSLQLADALGTAIGTGVGGAIVAAGEAVGLAPARGLGLVFALMAVIALLAMASTSGLPRHVTAKHPDDTTPVVP